MRTLAKNLVWGMVLSLACAVVLVAYVTILFLVAGQRPFVANGITYGKIVWAYLAGGLGGGIIVGLLRPLTRRRAGGILTGILVATCAYGAIAVGISGWVTRWDTGDWVVLAILGLGGGTYGGNSFWEEFVYPKLPPPLSDSDEPPRRRPLGLWRQ